MSDKDKKKTIAEQADDIRKELDDLIGDSPLDVENDPKDLPIQAKPTALAPMVNYTELKSGATKKAQKTITSLMKFYLDADIIEKDDYIQAKKKMAATLAGNQRVDLIDDHGIHRAQDLASARCQ